MISRQIRKLHHYKTINNQAQDNYKKSIDDLELDHLKMFNHHVINKVFNNPNNNNNIIRMHSHFKILIRIQKFNQHILKKQLKRTRSLLVIKSFIAWMV